MIVYEVEKRCNEPLDCVISYFSDWQRLNKKHAKHLRKIGQSTEKADQTVDVLKDVINQVLAVKRQFQESSGHKAS